MLCICQGPTLTVEPATATSKVKRLNAGDIQRAMHATLAVAGADPCLHDRTVQHRKEGRAVLTIQETRIRQGASGLVLSSAAALAVASDPALSEIFPEQVEQKVIAEAVGVQESWVSPTVLHICAAKAGQPVSLVDFPVGHAFGNGVTCNSWVTLQCGENKLLSWCVLTPDAATRHKQDAGARETLRRVMEG